MKALIVGAVVGALAASAAMSVQVPAPRPPVGRAPVADGALDDARRAAAGRLLVASRFRERQGVLLGDSVRAAQAALTTECIDRAAAGRGLADCRATAEPGPAVAARLTARRPEMLDEVMTASQTIYARRFSAAELDEITRFFRTPVGQKYGSLYPQVIADVQARKAAIVRRYLVDAAREPRR